MKQKHSQFRRTAVCSVLLSAGVLCSMTGMQAAAYTVDDVVQRSREVGIPEDQIQFGYNEWSKGIYTQEQLDEAYAYADNYQKTVDDKIDDIFDNPDPPPANDGNSTPAEGDGNSGKDGNAPAGSDAPVTSADFINMTLDEKIAYVNAMTADEKDAFLQNLSIAERNSIIKQMSISDKAEVMQSYVDVASAMGMNMVVDTITDDSIGVTIRDQDGVVIGKSAVGITIDETGISHTKLLAAAAGAFLLACTGFAWLYRRLRRMNEEV